MERLRIDSLEVNLKSAFRNPKSAILLGAMLSALCALLFSSGAAANEHHSSGLQPSTVGFQHEPDSNTEARKDVNQSVSAEKIDPTSTQIAYPRLGDA